MALIDDCVRMSKYAGERFDLIQSGGGNSSVKLPGGKIAVKASGAALSAVDAGAGFAELDNRRLKTFLGTEKLKELPSAKRERLGAKAVKKALLRTGAKPSIETLLHAQLYRFTLHTHPLAVNALLCRAGGIKKITALFSGQAAFVRYRTPGIDLALAVKEEIDVFIRKHGFEPHIIFLENHGLITSADSADEAIALTEKAAGACAKLLPVKLPDYRLSNRISGLVNSVFGSGLVAYRSNDADLTAMLRTKKRLFISGPFCPDGLVYCGIAPVRLKNPADRASLAGYKKKYGVYPKVVICGGAIFFIGASVRKAREGEEVFRFHILALAAGREKANLLSRAELLKLNSWEAEKYRQQVS